MRRSLERRLTDAVLAPRRDPAADECRRASIAGAFEDLYRPAEEGDLPTDELRRTIVDQFHRLYYHDSERTWRATRYRGVGILKCPLDLWVYQEVVHRLRPELIVETGTAHGGSAYFLGDLCDTVGGGRIVSIDIEAAERPVHPRVTYLHGSSVDPSIIGEVTARLPSDGPVLVILDSDHRQGHVRRELEVYAPMVSVGSYIVVEDSNVHGHPALPSFPAGPREALDAFLAGTGDFVVDEALEKFMMTFNPRGFLRRVR